MDDGTFRPHQRETKKDARALRPVWEELKHDYEWLKLHIDWSRQHMAQRMMTISIPHEMSVMSSAPPIADLRLEMTCALEEMAQVEEWMAHAFPDYQLAQLYKEVSMRYWGFDRPKEVRPLLDEAAGMLWEPDNRDELLDKLCEIEAMLAPYSNMQRVAY